MKIMFNKIIVLILSTFVLSGCVDSFRAYFKKSANNKVFDSKGFKGGKRTPLYNKKYVNLAKKNILEDNFDEEDEEDTEDNPYEQQNSSQTNRQMYMDMIRQDYMRKKQKKGKSKKYHEDYPALTEANDKVNANKNSNSANLEKEIAEIKSMLDDAKKELSKYKCPLQSNAKEQKSAVKAEPAVKPDAKGSNKPLMHSEDDYGGILN